MGDSNRSLQEFVTFLGSPDMYGSMSMAAQMLKWAVHLVVTLLMIAGIVAILFVVAKVAVDIVFLSGIGQLLNKDEGAMGKFNKRLEGFASTNAINGEIGEYIKQDIWKVVLTLAFIGLLASGMLLPIAGQVAGVIGAGVDRIIGLDPAGQVANFDWGEFQESVTYTRDSDLKADYDKYVSEAESYMNYIYDLGSSRKPGDDPAIQKYKRLYTSAMLKATAVSRNVQSANLKLPEQYFKQHEDLCKSEFMDGEVKSEYGGVSVC